MPAHPPFLVSYSITTRCNLKCKHCYSESVDEPSPDELSTREALNLIDQIKELGASLLILDGGEPLMRDDFLRIATYASLGGLITVVGSNGALIDLEMAKKMRKTGIRSVAISLDGTTPEVHDSFRGEAGSFYKALLGAQYCNVAGLPIQFGMILRKGNLHQINDIFYINDTHDTQALEFFDLVLTGRAKREIPEEALSVDQRKEVMTSLAERQALYRVPIRVVACPMYPLILQEKKVEPKLFDFSLLERIPYYKRGCAAGMPFGYLVIRSNGDVHPCMLLQIKLGNIRRDKLSSIWNESTILKELRDRDNLKGYCRSCDFRDQCAGCRGRAFEETGDYLQTDPGCWHVKD